MIYKITIKDKDDNLLDVTNNVNTGFSEHFKLSESLDVASMTISHIDREEVFGMFDVVFIRIDNTILHSFRVQSDDVTLVSKRPSLYKHELSLIEPIKLFEREIVNGFKVTQPTDESFTYTLYDVVERLRKTVPLEKNDLLDDTRLFLISSEAKSALEQIVSPEFTWNNYTLRQCLDEVCSIVDGIAKIDGNGIFDIQFFNETYDFIGSVDDTFNDKRRSQDIEFYATNMEISAVNLINDNEYSQSVEIYPANGYVTPRSDDYYVDFLKSYVPTPKRIYDIPKMFHLEQITLTLGTPFDGTLYEETDTGLYSLEISDRVVEKDRYRTLPTTASGYDLSQFTTIFYQRYKNNVNISDTYGLFDTKTIIDNTISKSNDFIVDNSPYLLANAVGLSNWVDVNNDLVDPRYQGDVQTFGDLPATSTTNYYYYVIGEDTWYQWTGSAWASFSPTGTPYNVAITLDAISGSNEKDYLFQTHYIPVSDNSLISVERDDVSDVYYKLSLLSNQQARIIDFDDLTSRGKGKINRIGNEDLSYSHTVTDPNDLFKNGDYTDNNYIVGESEYIYFKDYIVGKYVLTKNFNRISKFIGVNSQIRQWEIATGDNTQMRNFKYKDYCLVDVHNESTSVGSNTGKALMESGKNTILETIYGASTLEPSRAGYLINPYNNDVIYLSASSNGSKANILHFEFDVLDNVNVGNNVIDDGFEVGGSGVQDAIEGVRYTDEYGRLNELNSWLITNLGGKTNIIDYREQGKLLPLIDPLQTPVSRQVIDLSDFPIEKDGGEILRMSYQVDFFTKNKNVIIGEQFIKRNRLISENPLDTSGMLIYYYNDLKLNSKHKLYAPTPDSSEVVGGVRNDGTIQSNWITIDKANNRYLFTFQNMDGKSSWALVTSDGRTILAVNQDNNEAYYNMTFDFQHFRDGVYKVQPSPSGGFDGVINVASNFTYSHKPYKRVVDSINGVVTTTLGVTYTVAKLKRAGEPFSGSVNANLNFSYTAQQTQTASGTFAGSSSANLSMTYGVTKFKSASGSFNGSVSSSLGFTYDPCWTECNFDTVDTYFSATDESVNETAQCGDNVTKTICTFDTGTKQWLCTDYIGVVSTKCAV